MESPVHVFLPLLTAQQECALFAEIFAHVADMLVLVRNGSNPILYFNHTCSPSRLPTAPPQQCRPTDASRSFHRNEKATALLRVRLLCSLCRSPTPYPRCSVPSLIIVDEHLFCVKPFRRFSQQPCPPLPPQPQPPPPSPSVAGGKNSLTGKLILWNSSQGFSLVGVHSLLGMQ